MRLSTKGRFAITAMIELAVYERSGPVSLSQIAARHQISLSYLEQMFSQLRRHRLVDSTRGPGGGYRLARGAENITVADVLGAIEGNSDEGRAGTTRRGDEQPQDMAQDLWDRLDSRMVAYMRTVTLRELALEQLAKGYGVEVRKPARRGVGKKPAAPPVWANTPNSVFAFGQSLLVKG